MEPDDYRPDDTDERFNGDYESQQNEVDEEIARNRKNTINIFYIGDDEDESEDV